MVYDIIIVCEYQIYLLFDIFNQFPLNLFNLFTFWNICAFILTNENFVLLLISVVSKPGDKGFYFYDGCEPVTIDMVEESMKKSLAQREEFERIQKQMGIFKYYNDAVLPDIKVNKI